MLSVNIQFDYFKEKHYYIAYIKSNYIITINSKSLVSPVSIGKEVLNRR